MGTLKVIGSALYQWEIGRKIRVLSSVGDRAVMVQFAHPGDKEALSVTPREENGVIVADVPNILLQSGDKIVAFLVEVDANCVETTRHSVFHVVNRPKPADYIYTETEVLNYTYLDNRLKELEGDGLAKAVADYLKENPIEAGATAEEAAQIQQNKTDIEQLAQEKLDADKLPEAVNDALAQAKASGEFDGNEYVLTEADKTEIAEQAAEMVDIPEGNTAELFFAVYGETTYAEVTEALDDGKMVYVKYSTSLVPYVGTSGNHYFQFINNYGFAVSLTLHSDNKWNSNSKEYLTSSSLSNYYNKNQVDDLLDGLETGGSNQPLTFTGAVNATYDGSEAVSVEIPAGGGGEERIYAEEQLATGTISSDSAGQKLNGVFETGLTLGDLKKWKSFVFKLRGAANADPGTSYLRLMNTNYSNDYNAISLVRTSASGVCVVFEWADTARTVLSLVSAFAGTNTYVEYIGTAFAGTENNAWRLAAGETTAAIAGWVDLRNCADTQVVAVTKSPAATDYLWEIRGLAK